MLLFIFSFQKRWLLLGSCLLFRHFIRLVELSFPWLPLFLKLLLELRYAGAKRRINCHESANCFEKACHHGFVLLLHLWRDARILLVVLVQTFATLIADSEQADQNIIHILVDYTVHLAPVLVALTKRTCW